MVGILQTLTCQLQGVCGFLLRHVRVPVIAQRRKPTGTAHILHAPVDSIRATPPPIRPMALIDGDACCSDPPSLTSADYSAVADQVWLHVCLSHIS